ncbi:alpha/beta fold hydrolase [Halorussus salinisoli]|uniref:alpha/beta fold hydrolase n=1 Tax=Halorussus salinisoli TaxID=2558242 RepID=UPI002A90B982|nr:alpha/beta hydrolase [Halorussus salinisoli]
MLVHGTAGDHTVWDFVRPALEEHHTVYAMDRRGYGASGDADEYALEREFEDVAAVVESIDEPVVLFGHSFGAFISLEAALWTDNLRQLILYGPPIFSYRDRESIHEAKLPEMKALHDAGECEQMIVFFLREVAELPPAAIEEMRAAPDWQDTVDSAHAVFREIRAETEYEFDPARFADVDIPTLLLSGSESPARFHVTVGAIDVALPDSRITTLEGQGHAGISTAPDQVSEEVLAFIRESG